MDPEKFRNRWESYANEIERLKINLPEERYEEVEEIKDNLKEIIDIAAKIEGYEICWNCEKDIGGKEQERCGHCGVPIK